MVPHYWDFVRKYVDDALQHANGELNAEDVREYLQTERMYLFVAQRRLICGAAVCEVVQYVRKKAIRVVTIGGEDFADWRSPLLKQLDEWGSRINADGIEAYVRAGLVPQLKELGFAQTYLGMWYGKK